MERSRALQIPVVKTPAGQGLPLPAYMSERSAGMDLLAAVEGSLTLGPGERRLVPAGIRVAIPEGFEGQVRPRSGLALRQGVTVLNAPGTIDSDYRGEVGVVLVNLGAEPFVIERGDRIAQLVICPVGRATWEERESIDTTSRDQGGFGHTGLGQR